MAISGSRISNLDLMAYDGYLLNYIGHSKNVALLLDYDGTLTPIVAHPDLATIPQETKCILQHLVKIPGIYVAIVSGRNVENVKSMVGINEIVYAGNHGLEVLFPDGTRYVHQLPKEFEDNVNNLISQLEKKVVRDGAWIENKGASLTFHFRNTPENLRPEIETTARNIMEKANFKVGNAHCALEAKPKVDWNKGKVSLMLLEKEFGKNWAGNVKVVFIGDDTTDEDAMRELKGNSASFRISTDPHVQTYADKLLSSTVDVVQILKMVQRLFK